MSHQQICLIISLGKFLKNVWQITEICREKKHTRQMKIQKFSWTNICRMREKSKKKTKMQKTTFRSPRDNNVFIIKLINDFGCCCFILTLLNAEEKWSRIKRLKSVISTREIPPKSRKSTEFFLSFSQKSPETTCGASA